MREPAQPASLSWLSAPSPSTRAAGTIHAITARAVSTLVVGTGWASVREGERVRDRRIVTRRAPAATDLHIDSHAAGIRRFTCAPRSSRAKIENAADNSARSARRCPAWEGITHTVERALTTDQKVGGSSPSERAPRLRGFAMIALAVVLPVGVLVTVLV